MRKTYIVPEIKYTVGLWSVILFHVPNIKQYVKHIIKIYKHKILKFYLMRTITYERR
jgi:hypothetical protein